MEPVSRVKKEGFSGKEYQFPLDTNGITYVGTLKQLSQLFQSFLISLSDYSTALTTGVKESIQLPYPIELQDLVLSVDTAPTGSPIIVDILVSDISIFTTPIQIDIGHTQSGLSSVQYKLLENKITEDTKIKFEILQIGSATAGTGLKLYVESLRK